MLAALKAELRKLFSVRSTYVILGICLALEIFFAFYATAYHASPMDARDHGLLAGEVTDAVNFLTKLLAIVGILLVTHEYRYNTIVYSLTSSKKRLRVLASKFAVISMFTVLFTAFFGMLSPLLAKLGFAAHHVALSSQTFDIWGLLWRAVMYGWGIAMLGLVFAFIIRIQVGALAALFLIPGTVEQLLGLLLKKNQVYLPFSSLEAVLNKNDVLSYGHAALVALGYIVLGFVVSAWLFNRRDAN
ncbi:MAG TPA: ABC transporter permease [Candidatus Saccharimonadales bacterium]|nr:ABC transporter permease [Candidatus Saccharimonadales bacterium]